MSSLAEYFNELDDEGMYEHAPRRRTNKPKVDPRAVEQFIQKQDEDRQDIAFTYNFINEKGLGAFKQELGSVPDKNAFEAPDDTTLIWHMDKTSLTPEHPPYIPILPEHVLAALNQKRRGDAQTLEKSKQ